MPKTRLITPVFDICRGRLSNPVRGHFHARQRAKYNDDGHGMEMYFEGPDGNKIKGMEILVYKEGLTREHASRGQAAAFVDFGRRSMRAEGGRSSPFIDGD